MAIIWWSNRTLIGAPFRGTGGAVLPACFHAGSSCAFQYTLLPIAYVVVIARAYAFRDLKVGQVLVIIRLHGLSEKCFNAKPWSVLNFLYQFRCWLCCFQARNNLCALTSIWSLARTIDLARDILCGSVRKANENKWLTYLARLEMSIICTNVKDLRVQKTQNDKCSLAIYE